MNALIEFLKDIRLVIGCLTFTIVVNIIDNVFDLNEPGLSTACYVMLYLLCLNLFCLRAYITFLKEDIEGAVERGNIWRDRLDESERTYSQDFHAYRHNLNLLRDENETLRLQLIRHQMYAMPDNSSKEQRRILEL